MIEQTTNKQSKCAQCKQSYKPGLTVPGCHKCAPGVIISEEEFKMPIDVNNSHNLVSDVEYLRIFHAARNGSDKPCGYLRGIKAVIAAYEAANPQVAQPLIENPGSPEARAAIDAELAIYGYPANPTNAARAGFVACLKLNAGRLAVQPLTDKEIGNRTAHLYLNGKSVPAEYRISVVKTATATPTTYVRN